jgi:hypothetical protein
MSRSRIKINLVPKIQELEDRSSTTTRSSGYITHSRACQPPCGSTPKALLAERRTFCSNKAIKELLKGDLEHHIQDVIGGFKFEIKITTEKLIVASVSTIR